MLPLAFVSIAGGLLLLVAGVTGSSLASVVKGSPDGTNAVTPTGASATSSAAGAASSPSSPALAGIKGETGPTGSLPAAALTRLRQIAAAHGWSVADWLSVISLESGGNPRAENASGAYGIGQALGSTKTTYPKMVSPNAATQVEGMAEYIAGRYGTPTKALEHEHAFNWY